MIAAEEAAAQSAQVPAEHGRVAAACRTPGIEWHGEQLQLPLERSSRQNWADDVSMHLEAEYQRAPTADSGRGAFQRHARATDVGLPPLC
jgi:hypothetical protein